MKRKGTLGVFRCGRTWIALAALSAAGGAKAQELKGFGDDIAALKANGQFCEIIVTRNGTLVQNVDATELGSATGAGLAGAATVTTSNASYDLVAEAPSGFAVMPATGNQGTVFSSSLSGRGATTFFDQPGNRRTRLKKGTTNIEVNLSAKKLSGSFAAGNYRADLTLRCE